MIWLQRKICHNLLLFSVSPACKWVPVIPPPDQIYLGIPGSSDAQAEEKLRRWRLPFESGLKNSWCDAQSYVWYCKQMGDKRCWNGKRWPWWCGILEASFCGRRHYFRCHRRLDNLQRSRKLREDAARPITWILKQKLPSMRRVSLLWLENSRRFRRPSIFSSPGSGDFLQLRIRYEALNRPLRTFLFTIPGVFGGIDLSDRNLMSPGECQELAQVTRAFHSDTSARISVLASGQLQSPSRMSIYLLLKSIYNGQTISESSVKLKVSSMVAMTSFPAIDSASCSLEVLVTNLLRKFYSHMSLGTKVLILLLCDQTR